MLLLKHDSGDGCIRAVGSSDMFWMIDVPFSSPCFDDTTTAAPVDGPYISAAMSGVRWRIGDVYFDAMAVEGR